ncbi:MAG: MCE family protein [Deltaproteobacteria bacterium]|nr:MCE family protein [Deltaproteobacteria bacterium]
MRDRGIEFKVGLLVLGALGVLAALIVTLGNFSLAKGFTVSVDFEFTGNLHAGAPVKVAGIRLGKVQKIEFLGGRPDPKTGRRVFVRTSLWLDDQAKGTVYSDAEFFINTQGVLGEQYVEIVPGTPAARPIEDGQVLSGVTPPRTDLIVARLYEFLEGATRLLTRERDTISDLLRSSAKAIRTVDTLLTANQDEIKRLLGSLDKFALETTELVKSVRAGVGDPRRLSAIVGNLDKTTASVSKNIDALLGKTSRTLDGLLNVTDAIGPPEKKNVKRALDQLVKLADRVYLIAGDARTMVERLARGKGSAGAILVKDELYDDLKEMVRDLKRNPWKFLWRE